MPANCPLPRIQAIDVVRPFLARIVGLAELKIRLAGSSRSSGRLAYLPELAALDLRARLLAGHHGLDLSTPEPAEVPLASVPTGPLVAAALLAPAALLTIALAVAIVFLMALSPTAAAALGGFLAVYVLAFGRLTWRRVVEQYGFSVAQAPDGIRVRRGLFSTVAETVPFQRVQAVRKVQPLLWRPWGWCRLEVDVAGSPGREQGTRSGRVTRALLPVGAHLIGRRPFVVPPQHQGAGRHGPTSTRPLEGTAQLPLPGCRPRRGACCRGHRQGAQGDHLGAPREDPEHPPGSGAGPASARLGVRPRRRRREARESRVPRQGRDRGGRPFRGSRAGGALPAPARLGQVPALGRLLRHGLTRARPIWPRCHGDEAGRPAAAPAGVSDGSRFGPTSKYLKADDRSGLQSFIVKRTSPASFDCAKVRLLTAASYALVPSSAAIPS